MTNKLAVAGILISLFLSAVCAWVLFSAHGNGAQSFGATTAGGLLAENYIPYVMYNGGYNSAKDINTSAFLGTTGTFGIGASGTTFSRINGGQCFFAPSGTTIAASTTRVVDCQATAFISTTTASALPGVSAGDSVQIEIATSTTGTTFAGLSAQGCSASSTPGYITCNLYNGTGATFTWPTTGAASGTASYLVVR